ncbi:MAG: mevalonate kinase [Phototrophicaceae bacterium]
MKMQTTAPAKIILCGEHAVVYDSPAIAIPVSELKTTAKLEETNEHFKIILEDTQETLTEYDEHPFIYLVKEMYNSKQLPNVQVRVSSEIPISSGLGSGASVASAIALLLGGVLSYDYANINEFVYQTEKHFHGQPSGIDNTVIVYQKPVYYRRHHPMEFIEAHTTLYFVIADTGIPAPTKQAVALVRSLYEADQLGVSQILSRITALVEQAKTAISNGDLPVLGEILSQNHHQLQLLSLSTPLLDQLVRVALDHGALGAKLSGGGMGGNMIALVRPEEIEPIRKALLNAGAKNVYQTKLEGKINDYAH